MAIFPAFPIDPDIEPGRLFSTVSMAVPRYPAEFVTETPISFANAIDNPNLNPSETEQAFCPDSFFDLLSGNIFIRPIAFQVGFVTSNVQLSALIWNTYDVDAELDNIGRLDPQSGISLDDFVVTDLVGARNDRTINYTVFGIGSTTIDDQFTYGFVDGITPLGTVFNTFVGFRGFNAVFEPLLAGYSEERLFSTDLFRSENGRETRAGLFNDPLPVRKLSFNIKVFRPGDIADLQALLDFALDSVILVPNWYDEGNLTAPTDGVSNEIFLDTTDREFLVGKNLVIFKSNVRACQDRLQFGTSISAVNPGSIILDAIPPAGFEIGDIVLPTLSGTPEKSTGWQYRSEKLALFQLDVSELR